MNTRNWTTIKEYSDIRFEFFEGIGKITINRPEVYNAFRPETNKEMIDAMDLAREDPAIGVVVLTGEGDKAFCSGGDQNVKGRGGYIGTDGYFLGDRIAPQSIELSPNPRHHTVVVVNYADRAEGELMTARPSVGDTRRRGAAALAADRRSPGASHPGSPPCSSTFRVLHSTHY